VLLVTSFFGTMRIFLDEPGEVLSIIDFVAEHLFAASGNEGLALVGSNRLVWL
jgi:hypothetical protein